MGLSTIFSLLQFICSGIQQNLRQNGFTYKTGLSEKSSNQQRLPSNVDLLHPQQSGKSQDCKIP